MSEPAWVTVDEVIALNAAVVKVPGEDHGIIHSTKLDAAVNRPLQHYAYGSEDTHDDLVLLGVKLCVGISESQGFIQGNKRTGFAAMEMFFNLNGHEIDGDAHGTIADLILASAAADKTTRLSEDDFADRLDTYVVEADADLLAGGVLSVGSINKIDQVLRALAERDGGPGITGGLTIDPLEPPILKS